MHLKHVPIADLSDRDRLWFFSLAFADLQQSQLALANARICEREKLDDQLDGLYDCLHDAAVLRYCKPFDACRLPDHASKSTRLLVHDVFHSSLPAKGPQAHQRLLKLRDEVIAHSDLSAKNVRVMRYHQGTRERITSEWAREVLGAEGLNNLLAPVLDEAIRAVYRMLDPLMRQMMRGAPFDEMIDVRNLPIQMPDPRT